MTLNGVPYSPEIAKELCYGRILIDIDPEHWMPLRRQFFDIKGNQLKTTAFENHVQVDGIWTQQIVRCVNQKTRRQSVFVFSNIDFATNVDPADLDQRALERGARLSACKQHW